MKKIISVLLTAILLCCFIFSSFAEEAQDSIHLDSTGITVALTDAMKNAKGQIQGMGQRGNRNRNRYLYRRHRLPRGYARGD